LSFLIPRLIYTSQAVGNSVVAYTTTATSYRKVADGIGIGDTDRSAGRMTVYRWVNALADKAEKLVFQVQKESLLVGRQWQELEALPEKGTCPNAPKARTQKKAEHLNMLALLISMAQFLLGCERFVLEQLHAHFLKHVESPQLIFSGGGIRARTPQSMGHQLF
jgi:hypothetical protein